MAVITVTAPSPVEQLIKAHASKSLSQAEIDKKGRELIEASNTGSEAVQTYYQLFPTVIRLGSIDVTISGTKLTLPTIFKIAFSIDSRWFSAFFNGEFADSKQKSLKELDPTIFELFKDHFYKKVPLKSFDEKIELIRFCSEYELPKQAKELLRNILLNFESLEESEEEILIDLCRELNDERLGLCILYLKCMHFDYEYLELLQKVAPADKINNAIEICKYQDMILSFENICELLSYCSEMELEKECEYLSSYMAKRLQGLNTSSVVKCYMLAKKHNLQTLQKTLDFYYARIRTDESVENLNFLQFLGVKHLYVHCALNHNYDLLTALSTRFPNVEYIEVFAENVMETVEEEISPFLKLFTKLKKCEIRSINYKIHTVGLNEMDLNSSWVNTKTFSDLNASSMPKLPHAIYTIFSANRAHNLVVVPYNSSEQERNAMSEYLEKYGVVIKPGYIAKLGKK